MTGTAKGICRTIETIDGKRIRGIQHKFSNEIVTDYKGKNFFLVQKKYVTDTTSLALVWVDSKTFWKI